MRLSPHAQTSLRGKGGRRGARATAGARESTNGRTRRRARAFSSRHLALGCGERREGIDSTHLRLVLGDSAIRGNEVDGRERLGVQVGLHILTLLVATELVHGQVGGRGVRVELALHRLAELAPGRVDHHHGLLARARDSADIRLSRESLHALGGVPQVAVERLLGTLDVNAALGLHGAVLVLEADEATEALRGVVEPFGLVANPLVVLEGSEALLGLLRALIHRGHRDGVLEVTMRRVAVLVAGVVRHLVLGDVVEDILQSPVGERVALGEAAVDWRVLKLVDPRALKALPALSYCSMSSRQRLAPYFLSKASLSAAGTPSGPKISALKLYLVSRVSRKGIVSGKRWKVSTTMTLHLPFS